MAGFTFRLNSVLSLRRHARQQRQVDLSHAMEQLRACQNQEHELVEQQAELERHMRQSASEKKMDIDRLLDGHRHHVGLKMQMRELTKAMELAAREVERCHAGLVEADREVKMLEKLCEQQLEEHERAEASREMKQFDEVASIRWQREGKS